MDKKIKILVITYLPWREDNSVGNSYSNIFRNTDDKYEFAHIYVRDGMPQNSIVHDYYHISEKKLLKNLIRKKEEVGVAFHLDKCIDTPKEQFSNLYNKARILRWEIFFWLREIAGISNCWKTENFENFIDDFKPDLIFGTLSAYPIISNMMCYISKSRNIPLVTYPWDDHYTLKRTSWSPIFWLRRFQGRHFQRKSVKQSSYMYVISNLMQREYQEIFKKECRLLFKGYDFAQKKNVCHKLNSPIKLLYMGNIGGGRWKTLALLANGIKEINERHGAQMMFLDIYTLSPSNIKILSALNIENVCKLNNPVPNNLVDATMDAADILVHAEPYNKHDYQYYRASFSTKLVDYFYRAKCILSIGGMTASTDYLLCNDATIYIKGKDSIIEKLTSIIENPQIILEYSKKSWNCGVKNHQINRIQENVFNDFRLITNK